MCSKLEIIHTDLKPENVMLGIPLTAREWRLPPLDACKHLMASAVASAEAANRPLNKNQKKRLKKKFKKRLEQGQIIHPTPIMPDGEGGAEVHGGSGDLPDVAEGDEEVAERDGSADCASTADFASTVRFECETGVPFVFRAAPHICEPPRCQLQLFSACDAAS